MSCMRRDGYLLAGHTTGHAWPLCYVMYLTRSKIREAAAMWAYGQGEGVSCPTSAANSSEPTVHTVTHSLYSCHRPGTCLTYVLFSKYAAEQL